MKTRRIAGTREEQLDRIIAAKRRTHRELRRPLDWAGFRAICAREDVLVELAPMDREAMLAGYGGVWMIVINANEHPRRHTYRGAHELGHLWAHVDQGPLGRFEACYHMDVEWPDDPREDEAEYIATLLLRGPGR